MGESEKKPKKKEDGKFPSKNIKHDPQAEGARAKFGLKDDNGRRD
ncbi:MAG: CPC_1213 family protein [Clostridia bacterium]|nr:CPC_1213 family protein [Clostridia bacterium]